MSLEHELAPVARELIGEVRELRTEISEVDHRRKMALRTVWAVMISVLLLTSLVGWNTWQVSGIIRTNRAGILFICEEIESHRLATSRFNKANSIHHGYTFDAETSSPAPKTIREAEDACVQYR